MMITVGTDTYISTDDATTYFAGRLYSEFWSIATTDEQESALRMATRMLDQQRPAMVDPTHLGSAKSSTRGTLPKI